MKEDGEPMTESELISEVIYENIPNVWRKDFLLNGLHKEIRIANVLEALVHFESCEDIMTSRDVKQHPQQDHRHHEREPVEQSRGKGQHTHDSDKHDQAEHHDHDTTKRHKKPVAFKNECGIHKGHEWKDCPSNRHSKNYNPDNQNKDTPSEKPREPTRKPTTEEQRFIAPDYDSDEDEEHQAMTHNHDSKTSRSQVLIQLPSKMVTLALVDSGSSGSLIARDLVPEQDLNTKTIHWKTQTGQFTTTEQVTTSFKLPQFSKDICEWTYSIMPETKSYSCIIGQDLISHLGLTLDYGTNTFVWKNNIVPMINLKSKTTTELKEIYELARVDAKKKELARLDAKKREKPARLDVAQPKPEQARTAEPAQNKKPEQAKMAERPSPRKILRISQSKPRRPSQRNTIFKQT
jgi:hypothetical protein